jgi:hypothetical protein
MTGIGTVFGRTKLAWNRHSREYKAATEAIQQKILMERIDGIYGLRRGSGVMEKEA